ncbi:MAG: phosphatidylserine decarboxylase, partial [Mycobacterium sp.]
MARRPRPTGDNLTFGPQRLLALLRSVVPPVHPAGLPFISAGLAVALGEVIAGRRYRWLRRAGLLTAAACAGFFRHPPRVPPTRPGVVVAPADGLICVVDSAAPPAELDLSDAPLPRVSIFLSLLDAHVQRAPVSGEVIAVQHRPGRFGSADLAAASDANERTSMRVRTADGAEIVVVQIAGLLARRIVCEARAGDKLSIGATYG